MIGLTEEHLNLDCRQFSVGGMGIVMMGGTVDNFEMISIGCNSLIRQSD